MPCADCYTGHDHSGPVYGRETTLHSHDVYVAEPQTKEVFTKGLIVVMSDAFGWNTTNLRGVADRYAERTGYRVYLHDFMYGTSAPASIKPVIDSVLNDGGFWGWLVNPVFVMVPFSIRNKPEKRYPSIRKFMDDLRCNEAADVKIGVMGFCWGAYAITHLAHGEVAANGKTIIDAAFTAHPSEISVARDITPVKLPYSMVIGDIDFALPLKEVNKAAEILEAKRDVDTEVVIIRNAKHGFAVRGNPDSRRRRTWLIKQKIN
ncbi:hypothetical protein ACHAP5_009300 [Fusarium lateritium]